MDTKTSKRIDKLDSLTNCPVCGSQPGIALGGRKHRKRAFECGAIFYVLPGEAIGNLLPCPAPSNTAATLLDLEIVQADHVAAGKAGAA